jgi:lipopolysaccharide transport system permease protein
MMAPRRFVDIVFFKAYADLRAERERTYLGFLWWVFEPVLYALVVWIVFQKVLMRGAEGFALFVLSGMVVWQWIKSCISHGSSSVLEAHGLIQQVRLPPVIFPLATILSDTVKFGFVLALLILVLAASGTPPSPALLALPLVLVAALAFICAVTIWLSAMVPFVPDLRHVTENVLMAMLFLSGIFYDVTSIPEPMQSWFFINPSARIIHEAREILLHGHWPAWQPLLWITGLSVVVSIAGAYTLERLRRFYPKLPR